jgi:hypothetical protein
MQGVLFFSQSGGKEELFCDACKSEQTYDWFSAYVRLMQHWKNN